MKKTHLKAVDPETLKIQTVYTYRFDRWRCYCIRSDGQYKEIQKSKVFNPETAKELSKQGIVCYVKRQIKLWEESRDFYKDREHGSRGYDQAIWSIKVLKDVLTYVLKQKG